MLSRFHTSLRAKLLLAVGILAFAAIGLVAFSVHVVHSLRQRINLMVQRNTQRLVLSSRMQFYLQSADHYLQDMLIEDQPAARNQDAREIDSDYREVVKGYLRLRKLSDAASAPRLTEFGDDFAQYQSVALDVQAALVKKNKPLAVGLSRSGRELFSDANLALRQIQARNDRRLREENQEVAQVAHRTALSLYGFSLLAIGLSLAVAYLLVSRVVRALRAIMERIRDIAQGEGDLTRRLPVLGADELGQLSGWFNRFMEHLHGLIASVAGSTERLACSSEEISAATQQQADGAERQSEQARRVRVSMGSIAATVSEVQNRSHAAVDTARQARETAQHGAQIIAGALLQSQSMAEMVSAVAGQVSDLERNSSQIGEIVGLINEIAEQIQLLALNAAIEAARAGEHGRGFGVVADEVRRLADRTRGATREITRTVQKIQGETLAAAQTIHEGSLQIERQAAETVNAGEALQRIVTMTEQLSRSIEGVNTLMVRQSQDTDEVNANTESIAQVAREFAGGAQQSARACQELSRLAHELQSVVGQFRLSEETDTTAISGADSDANEPLSRLRMQAAAEPTFSGAADSDARQFEMAEGGERMSEPAGMVSL